MKLFVNRLVSAIWVSTFGMATCAHAQDANAVYLTDDSHLVLTSKSDKSFVFFPEKIEAAKHVPECQPADQFPSGNWGEVEHGFQLSLRFDKDRFTNGEPISAILLIRNVTNSDIYLSYDLYPVGNEDGPIGFQVNSSIGDALPQQKVDLGIWNGSIRWLIPGTQCKYIERLDKRFNLTNGTYDVQAVKIAAYLPWPEDGRNHRPVFNSSLRQEVEIKSAKVKITIEDAH